jgi:replicative DNA helicase
MCDELLGAAGQPTQVVAATDVMAGRPCYQVEFCDGTVIVADADHQWPTDHYHGAAAETTHPKLFGDNIDSGQQPARRW